MKHAGLIIIPMIIMAAGCTMPSQSDRHPSSDPIVTCGGKKTLLDMHNLEPGKVTLVEIAAAHKKSLATQAKFGVNFIMHWVDEKLEATICPAEAPDSASIATKPKNAHWLILNEVVLGKQQ